jgi:hypothetical protein
MIVEIPSEKLDNISQKRRHTGVRKVSAQIDDRPRKVWIVELGYSSDTRYRNKVTGPCSGDGRAVIHSKSSPDTEQVLKATGLSGSGECPI